MSLAVHPEACGTPDATAARSGAVGAVEWFAANVLDSGRFLYRFDKDTGEALGGYNDPRHAGVLFSLYQAERSGVPGAAAVADRGLAHVDENTARSAVGLTFGRGSVVDTGSTALLVAALTERRIATGDDDRDDDLRSLGRSLVATVTENGAVDARIDRIAGPVADSRSPFFTGQVMFALARLETLFPAEGFGEAARRVRTYVLTRRDEVESHFPMLSDHWSTYALDEMTRWRQPPDISDAIEWIDRQLGLFSVQVRYESQRVGGVTRLTRGHQALPAGVGTLGEGLANLSRLVATADVDGVDEAALQDRRACVADLLVDRQTVALADGALPDGIEGAWFRLGVTQMDDQQHALSALLLLEDYLP